MKIYSKKNVFDAALDRIRFVFDEFKNVIVNFSGGKDSTVIYNLALIVAREKKRLPLTVLFIDQEAEWDATVDIVKEVMYSDFVKPMWMQIPIKIFNATSQLNRWLYCWEEGKEWIREKDKISIKKNIYSTDRFGKIFAKITEKEYGNVPVVKLNGIRAEESPRRFMGMTNNLSYKWITYGRIENKKLNHYAISPIYDWSYKDVWKAIHDNGWKYNKIYDYMYQYGVNIRRMRVSNLHHETALNNLFFMQEIEPENFNRLVNRISGINTTVHLHNVYKVKKLPFMFNSWLEYRNYLLDNLITDKKIRDKFYRSLNKQAEKYVTIFGDLVYKSQVSIVISNDYTGTKINNLSESLERLLYEKCIKKGAGK